MRIDFRHKLLALMAAACSVFLFIGGPDFHSARTFKGLWGFGHILLFASTGYLLLSYWAWIRSRAVWVQIICLLTTTLAVGLGIEGIQGAIGRSRFSWTDMLGNATGAMIAFWAWAGHQRRLSRPSLVLLASLILSSLLWFSYPVALAFVDEAAARRSFPVLSDFESPLEIQRWGGGAEYKIVRDVAYHGVASLRILLKTDHHSGVGLRYVRPDWRGYRYLAFSVFNPSKTKLKVTCRIHDASHDQTYGDRFNIHTEVAPGWNAIYISTEMIARAPYARRLDMSRIQGMGLFATDLDAPRLIYIDFFRLTQQAEAPLDHRTTVLTFSEGASKPM